MEHQKILNVLIEVNHCKYDSKKWNAIYDQFHQSCVSDRNVKAP